MWYLERNFLLLVTSASDLLVRTIRFRSVVFCVTSSLAVIHTIRCPPWLSIVRERAWSVSRCKTTATLTGYRAWRLVVEYPHTRNEKPAAGAIYKPRCSSSYWSQSQIFVENPDFSLPHLHSTPPLAGFPSEYRHPVWYVTTRMVWLPDCEKFWWYVYSFWHNSQTWQTDRHTQTPHDGIGRAYA